MVRPPVCLDFDGVLNEYSGFDKDNLGKLKPGADVFLEELSKKYKVIIFSARSFPLIAKWLKEHDLDRYVWDVTSIKPPAVAYVDDRAIRFKGDYLETLNELEGFKPYWKED